MSAYTIAPTDEQERPMMEALDLLSSKLEQGEAEIGVDFPYVTGEDGRWLTMPASLSAGYRGDTWDHGNWFCGFWVGLLLAAYLRTGSRRFSDWALERLQLVAPRSDDPNTHDIGFIFYSSALPAYHIFREPRYAALGIKAADRLRARLVTTRNGAYISSWGPLADARGRSSSAIDTMANLPLLYWAAEQADDASYRLAGEAHALTTAGAFVRDDGSTYHAVTYDLNSGVREKGYTFQGFGDESCWSRGQAWAIYGYAATARATRKYEYLALAERLAQYYLVRLDSSLVPYWDFDDPEIPNAPRDSSAAAIVASALLDVAALHPEPERARMWNAHAIAMLTSLCQNYLARNSQHRGLLLHGCYSRPHRKGEDSTVLFGDFYFTEALCKLLLPGKLVPIPERLSDRAETDRVND